MRQLQVRINWSTEFKALLFVISATHLHLNQTFSLVSVYLSSNQMAFLVLLVMLTACAASPQGKQSVFSYIHIYTGIKKHVKCMTKLLAMSSSVVFVMMKWFIVKYYNDFIQCLQIARREGNGCFEQPVEPHNKSKKNKFL